ncbi:MAG: hypothetical protein EXX96DRAFT_543339 [Benjaminiella poitrasii]|nr:MAG: hypothetical protein EXX96DRAFT_543339 [Benjaminiella poitrasii]
MSEDTKSDHQSKRRKYENTIVWRARIKDKPAFTCEYKNCNKQFDKQYNYKRHLKTHEIKEMSPAILHPLSPNNVTQGTHAVKIEGDNRPLLLPAPPRPPPPPPVVSTGNASSNNTAAATVNHNDGVQSQQQPIIYSFVPSVHSAAASKNHRALVVSKLINEFQPEAEEKNAESDEDDWKEPLIETAKRMKKRIKEREEELENLRAKLQTVEQILSKDS